MTRIRELALLLALEGVGGCGELCLNGTQPQWLVCDASGTAAFKSDVDGSSVAARVVTSGSCLPAEQSGCPGFDFVVTTAGAGDMSASNGGGGMMILSLFKTVRGHVTLPSPMVFISGAERSIPGTGSLEQLSLVDGTLDVDAPDDSHFAVAFTIHLRNSANQSFTMSGGQAQIDCGLAEAQCTLSST